MSNSDSIEVRVCKAKAAISKVAKTQFNKFGNYNYASVDDVYRAVREPMAQNNLDLRCSVVNHEVTEVGSGKAWLTMEYAIGFVGEEPQTSPISLPLTGAQTYEAARSYVCKQYLRQRFQIETGEVDVDASDPKESIPPKRVTKKKPKEKPQEKVKAKKETMPPNDLPSGVEDIPVSEDPDAPVTPEQIPLLRAWSKEHPEVLDLIRDKLPKEITQSTFENAKRLAMALDGMTDGTYID